MNQNQNYHSVKAAQNQQATKNVMNQLDIMTIKDFGQLCQSKS